MLTVVTIIHVVMCVALIAIVLLQTGKGAEMGSAFGGASNTIFGGAGPASFLNKVTTIAAIVFMLSSFTLAILSGRSGSSSKVLESPVQQTQPASTATPAADAQQAQPVSSETPTSEMQPVAAETAVPAADAQQAQPVSSAETPTSATPETQPAVEIATPTVDAQQAQPVSSETPASVTPAMESSPQPSGTPESTPQSVQ